MIKGSPSPVAYCKSNSSIRLSLAAHRAIHRSIIILLLSAHHPCLATTTGPTSAISSPQANPYLTTNRSYYGIQSPNTGNTFYPAHGAQFAQNVDPSLLRQADGRAFPQTGSLPSTASQSSATIAPSSLQQVLSRQVASPPVSMQSVFSMQTMNNPSRDLAVRPPAVNGSTPTQVPKAPKGFNTATLSS